MKRLLYRLLLALAIMIPAANLVSIAPAAAVDLFHNICTGANDSRTTANGSDVCTASTQTTQNPIVQTIGIVIGILSFIIGIAAVIMIIINGFRFVTSQGDPQAVASARTAIIYALVGLGVAITAGTIVTLVLTNL